MAAEFYGGAGQENAPCGEENGSGTEKGRELGIEGKAVLEEKVPYHGVGVDEIDPESQGGQETDHPGREPLWNGELSEQGQEEKG